MHFDWDNTVVTGISGIKIDMPTEGKVSIFTDNDLTHINNDHFKINLVAHLLNQIYVVPVYFTLKNNLQKVTNSTCLTGYLVYQISL